VKHVSEMCKVQGEKFIFFLSVHPVLFGRPGGAIALHFHFYPFLCYAGRLLTIDTTIEGNVFAERVSY
jgi:hypothetical protein